MTSPLSLFGNSLTHSILRICALKITLKCSFRNISQSNLLAPASYGKKVTVGHLESFKVIIWKNLRDENP